MRETDDRLDEAPRCSREPSIMSMAEEWVAIEGSIRTYIYMVHMYVHVRSPMCVYTCTCIYNIRSA